MEFRQLRYFVAVAESGNIAAAARKLHVSQPPITRQIQALEEDLQVALFVRSHRGVELTPAGTAFLEDARRIVDLSVSSGIRSRSAARGEMGQLNVAYFGTAVLRTVPQLLRAFLAKVPTATCSLVQMSKDAQIQALAEGTIHIGFGRFYPHHPDVKVAHVLEEKLFIASTETIGTRGAKTCRISDLRSHRVVLYPQGGRPNWADAIIGLFKIARIAPNVAGIVEDVNAALALTYAGVGITVVPESVASMRWPGLTFTELGGPRATIPVSCIYRNDSRSPILATFIRLVEAVE